MKNGQTRQQEVDQPSRPLNDRGLTGYRLSDAIRHLEGDQAAMEVDESHELR